MVVCLIMSADFLCDVEFDVWFVFMLGSLRVFDVLFTFWCCVCYLVLELFVGFVG